MERKWKRLSERIMYRAEAGLSNRAFFVHWIWFESVCLRVCLSSCVWEKDWKGMSEGNSHQITLAPPPPPPPLLSLVQSSQPGVGVGYANPGRLSACPFRGSRAARCFLHTHPHSCRVLRTWMVEPSQQVSHTIMRVCVWERAETFLETHSSLLLSSVLLSYCSFPPSSRTPLCCFPCPSSSPLPLQLH